MKINLRITWIAVFLVFGFTAKAATKRILVVGDSWAAGMTHQLLGAIFDRTLKTNGFKDIAVLATDQTAMPGSHAAWWAANQEHKLDHLRQTLETNSSIDIVFIVLGGADFLLKATQTNLAQISLAERTKIWRGIATNLQTIAHEVLLVRPHLKVVLCDYDYLNLEKTKTSFLKWDYHGISQADFNRCFVELGREKRALAEQNSRILYVQNWGVLQNKFSRQEDAKKFPLPGGPPKYDPYPGGDPIQPSPAEAFFQIGLNDGVHPNAEGYQRIIENCLKQGLGAMLKAGETNSAAK